ncbi:MAG: hypothetical protein AAF957_12175 [Planctomycetota bacterium]
MARRIVHCHCVYAKVVPARTKDEVLERLGASGVDFEAVPDLCEMSARKDEALASYANDGDVEIVACFPRAVRWLFHSAGHDLAADAKVLNMRESSADEVCAALELEEEPTA